MLWITLTNQILVSGFLSGKEIVGDRNSYNTIDLLRYSAVEAPLIPLQRAQVWE